MKKILFILTLFLTFNLSLTANSLNYDNNVLDINNYKNVILFIGDGMGPNHVDAAEVYLGDNLCFNVTDDKWTYHAYSNTDSKTSEGFTLDETKSLTRPEQNPSLYDGTPSPYDPNSKIGLSGNITTYTDSGAGGTALATGKKVTNSRISMDIDGSSIETLVEIAKGLNKKTGVVTSDEITGATPSDFLVHVASRYDSDKILQGIATSKADLVLGKTTSDYKNNKMYYDDLYKSNGYHVVNSKNTLVDTYEKIIGIFPGVTPFTDPRTYSLAELTVFALDYLDNEEGFFLMVEGANIDKQSHSNQAKLMLNELLGFNEAIEAAMKWAENRNDTLMVVTADHETGGLYFDRETATKDTIVADIKWLSQNHSRTRVDVAVYGDISEFINKFGHNFKTLENLPYIDNTDVFRLCAWYLTN